MCIHRCVHTHHHTFFFFKRSHLRLIYLGICPNQALIQQQGFYCIEMTDIEANTDILLSGHICYA